MNPFNPISGFGAAGLRFKVRIRAISHQNLYLPVKMRHLPQLRSLIDGVSPLKVFSCSSIIDARKAFCELRKKYDFPFWALLDFKVPNPVSHRMLEPLRLNRFQNYLAHVFSLGRVSPDMYGYIVSKTIPKCGLSSCVQAYIAWLKTYWNSDNSLTLLPYRQEGSWSDLASSFVFFHRYDVNPGSEVNGSYIHLADTSRFADSHWDITTEIINHVMMYFLNTDIRYSTSKVSLFVIEGDRPKGFRPKDYMDHTVPAIDRFSGLYSIKTQNPCFLRHVVEAADPKCFSYFRHIDLDTAPDRIFPPRASQDT